MGVKAAARGLGSEICKGCKATMESFVHLFTDFPCLMNFAQKFCDWIAKVWRLKISKMRVICASWESINEPLSSQSLSATLRRYGM